MKAAYEGNVEKTTEKKKQKRRHKLQNKIHKSKVTVSRSSRWTRRSIKSMRSLVSGDRSSDDNVDDDGEEQHSDTNDVKRDVRASAVVGADQTTSTVRPANISKCLLNLIMTSYRTFIIQTRTPISASNLCKDISKSTSCIVTVSV